MNIREIISLFEKAQRIPYYCLRERDPDKLLKMNKGCCLEKNGFLGREYKKLGIQVKYLLINFDWRSLPIPRVIIDKKEDHLGQHLAIKIQIDGKWVIVDSTWDPGLEKAGFPVTKNWDGKSDTELAVKPLQIVELKEQPSKMTVTTNAEFFAALNEYLKGIRRG